MRRKAWRSAGGVGTLLGVAASIALPALPAQGHRLSAQFGGVTCYDGIPCDADHIEGSYQVGVPGVDLNYVTGETGANSANGHVFSFSSFSWLEGTKPSSINTITEVIEENVYLQRILPGPVTARASLDLAGGAHVVGAGAIKLNGYVAFVGCHMYAEKTITKDVSTDLMGIPGGDIGCTLDESTISSFYTFTAEQNLPTYPLLRVQLQAVYSSLYLGSVEDLQWEGDLRVELTNATAVWDTPSFLTDVPEPDGSALAVVAALALAAEARRRRAAPRRPRGS